MTTDLIPVPTTEGGERFYPIEPSTGLPFLPAGYWWEVTEVGPDRWAPSKPPTYRVSIRTTEEVPARTVAKERTTLQKLLFLPPEEETIAAYTREVSAATLAIWDKQNEMPLTAVTPVDIARTAQRVAHNFYERKRQDRLREETKKYLGKYPPLNISY